MKAQGFLGKKKKTLSRRRQHHFLFTQPLEQRKAQFFLQSPQLLRNGGLTAVYGFRSSGYAAQGRYVIKAFKLHPVHIHATRQ